MSALGETFAKLRPRIIAEMRRSLLEESRGEHTPLSLQLEELFDGVVARTHVPDAPELPARLRLLLTTGATPAELLGGLMRLAAHMRAALFRESLSRRVAEIASSALDRVLADSLEELDDVLTSEHPKERTPAAAAPAAAPTVLEQTVTEAITAVTTTPASRARVTHDTAVDAREAVVTEGRRDPTIIRNIREVLAGPAGEDMIASVLVLAPHAHSTAHGMTMVSSKLRVQAVARAIVKRAGAVSLEAGAGLVAAYLPARVNDADAEEALTLAVELVRTPELRTCGVGVARGRLCAEAGGASEVFGEAFLEATMLAARAEAGRVFCSGTIHSLTRNAYVMRSVASTLTAFAVNPEQPQWSERWEQAALIAEPSLVGRTELTARLTSCLADAPPHRASLVGLRGRAGSGKHRLLAAAFAAIEKDGKALFRGAPHPVAPVPYWPLVAVVRQALGREAGDLGPSAIQQALGELTADPSEREALLRHAPALESLLCPSLESDSVAEDSEPAIPRAQMAAAVLGVFEARGRAAGGPLVVAVSDAQGMDAPTAEALGHLLRHYSAPAPLTVILSYRRAFRLPAGLAGLPHRELTIGRLGDEAILDIARSMLDQEDLPAELAHTLTSRAGGSPAMAAATIRYLVEAGCLQRKAGAWLIADPSAGADLPRRLPELLQRRVEQLPPTLLAVLKAAATLGDPVTWPTLELVAVNQGISRDELARAATLLAELGFLMPPTQRDLAFTHPLVREVTLRIQSVEERGGVHRLAAAALEERYPGARVQLSAVLFAHLAAGGEAGRARAVAVRAVRRAAQLGDFRSALKLAAEALALSREQGAEALACRFDILLAREQIHDVRGRRADQKTDIKAMVGLAESLHDEQRLGRALHRAARLNLLCGDAARARAVAHKAVERLRRGDPLHLSNALRTLALVLWHERDPAGARAALDEALAIYTRSQHRRGMGFVLHSLGLFALDSGALDQARRHLTQALALKRETHDTAGEAAVLDALGQAATCDGDLATAATSLEAALALRAAAGDAVGAAQTRLSLAECLLSTDPKRAEALARDAMERLAREKRGRADIEARLVLARALLQQGKRESATRCAASASRRAQGLSSRLLWLRCQIVQAEIDLAYRGHERAKAAAEAAKAAAEAALRTGAVRWRVEALTLLAAAKDRLQDAEAKSAAQEALALLRERRPVGLDVTGVRRRCEAIVQRHGA